MGKLTFLGITAVFWLFMNYLLYEKEIAPFLEYEKPPSYASILKDKRGVEISKWGIYYGSYKLGGLVTTITPNSSGYQIYTNVDFAISPLASNSLLHGKITSIIKTNVDDNFRLVDSDVETNYAEFNVRMEFKCKRRGDKLYFEYFTPIGNGSDTVDFPQEATLSNDFLPIYGTDKLKIGKKWELQMTNFDFFSGSIKLIPLYVSVEAREPHMWRKQMVDTYRIDIKKVPTKKLPIYTIWVTEDGEVIEQEFEFNNSHLNPNKTDKTTFRLVLEEKK